MIRRKFPTDTLLSITAITRGFALNQVDFKLCSRNISPPTISTTIRHKFANEL